MVCSIIRRSTCLIGAAGFGETTVARELVQIRAVSQGGWEDRRGQFTSKMETKIDDIWGRLSIVDG
jgi:hypothetical protein